MSSTKKIPIIIIVDNHQYDISEFDHPGDGPTLCIKNFHQKDVTKDFIIAHHTDEPSSMLSEARETGQCCGIKYVGPVLQNK
jgi:cytochrome b involved in lipid metabolism